MILPKLAFRGARRQISSYIIYFVTVALAVAIMFSINNILSSSAFAEMFPDLVRELGFVLNLLTVGITVIVAFIVCYITVFLLRKRKKELGTYLLLGIKRKNIIGMFALENVIMSAVSLGLGLLLGMAMFSAVSAFITNFIGTGFTHMPIEGMAFLITFLQWLAILAIAIIITSIVLYKSKIADLVKEQPASDKSFVDAKVFKISRFVVTGVLIAAGIVVTIAFLIWLRLDSAPHRPFEIQTFDEFRAMSLFVVPIIAILVGTLLIPKNALGEKITAFAALAVTIFAVTISVVTWNNYWHGTIYSHSGSWYMGVLTAGIMASVFGIFVFQLYIRSFFTLGTKTNARLKNANSFYFRQVSTNLKGNSRILALVAVLLSLAIFITNFAVADNQIWLEGIYISNPFAVRASWTHINPDEANNMQGYMGNADDVIEKAEQFTTITELHRFNFYCAAGLGPDIRTIDRSINIIPDEVRENAERQLNIFFNNTSNIMFVRASEVNPVQQAYGNDMYILEDNQFYLLAHYDRLPDVQVGYQIEILGQTLTLKGFRGDFASRVFLRGLGGWGNNFLIIVPDNFLVHQDISHLSLATNLYFNTAGHLPQEFTLAFVQNVHWWWTSNITNRFTIIELHNAEGAIVIAALLFLSITLMLFVLALLSVKILAGQYLDKKRYAILNMLGVSKRQRSWLLLKQILTFFLAPLLIPLLIIIPSAIISATASIEALGFVASSVTTIAIAVPLVFISIYVAYALATFFVSSRVVVR